MSKKVLIGVCSSVACFKTVQLVSDLVKQDYDVDVIMTKNATNFINPKMFSALTHKPTYTDTFQDDDYEIKHIELATKADVFIIVPASANTIGKIANGLADDMLSTTFLACSAPKIIAPAMNTNMYTNQVVQNNLQKCRDLGYQIVEPTNGLLACKAVGIGKLADLTTIKTAIDYALTPKTLKGRKILVSAGATQEAIDPVRFITNHSSGKQGYAIAKEAYLRGGEVTLLNANMQMDIDFPINVIHTPSAQSMFDYCKENQQAFDIIIMSSAVSDYTYLNPQEHKIKKHHDEIDLKLTKTTDILKYLGAHKPSKQILIGFCMETRNLLENARKKLINKNCDLIIANDLNTEGAGFKTDTNQVYFINNSESIEFPLTSKQVVAENIFNYLNERNLI